ncbi:hypothetical protein MUA02_01135 [Enterobacteriaceae bacterium H20N1]|uniref:CesD/SycD/LcrH family type III secretion system chaperone n=1 Tax=Dryocola boscaweniae TaxID=2925397 RepID=A0A9X2W3Z4_9ENTR|nr:hypothetical protein [Dryocola boscaweniae]MCT4700511.1 hypothetical protein [Dryocola boscaweniae]MCT4717667.1 hypothetical protein [Dryocola boscaweniae]
MIAPDDIGQLRAFFASGGALYMLNDTSREEMDTLWRYACQLLQQDDAAGARNLLQLLVYNDGWNSDFLLTLGVACQRMKAHEEALFYLAQAARILVVDPRPSWLMAQSAMAMARWDSVSELLTSTLTLAAEQPAYRELVATARKQLLRCQRQLSEGENG